MAREELQREIRDSLAGVYAGLVDLFLFAPPTVVEAAGELEITLYEIEFALIRVRGEDGEEEPYWSRIWKSWHDLGGWARWSSAVEDVLVAMRADAQAHLEPLPTLTRTGGTERAGAFTLDEKGRIIFPEGQSGPN